MVFKRNRGTMIDYAALEGVFDTIAAIQLRVEEQTDLIDALSHRVDALEWMATDE